MRVLRIILFFPLALFRLIFIFIISFFTVCLGWLWLDVFGFSRKLQSVVMKVWGRSVLFICGIIVTRNKIPANGNFILMPNHRSYIDIFLVAAYTPSAFVAKAELTKWPFLGTGAKLTNTIFVNRSEITSLVSTMNKIKSSVQNNIPVAVFPEGTTSRGPLTRPFKKGSFKIAADANIPVIPVAIHYKDKNDAWVDDDTFVGHFLKQMTRPVTKVSVCYGSPLYYSNQNILLQETRQQIDSMLKILIAQD